MNLHTHTPTLAVSEPRGLIVRRIAWHRTAPGDAPQRRVTGYRFDLAGRETGQADPRLFRVGDGNFRRWHGLSGKELGIDSVDAGWRRTLVGAEGQSKEGWDSRASHFFHLYDDQRRPLSVHERVEEGAVCTVERFNYGDENAPRNLRGFLLRHDDPAGSWQVGAYGLRGEVICETRRVLANLDMPDWPADVSGRDALLDDIEGYTTHYGFDAAGGLVRQIDAAGHQRDSRYDQAGQVRERCVRLAHTQHARQVFSAITYDATGRFSQEKTGNGTVSQCGYDLVDGRLLRVSTARACGEPLQDLRYEYDPVGNIVSIADAAQPTRFHGNRRIDPVSHYRYDTLYQLVEATGREVVPSADIPGLPPQLRDPNQLRHYTQRFDYDEAGNLLARHHTGTATRRMAVSALSNRGLPQRVDGSLPDEAAIASGFDANGNQRELQPGQAMDWDARNQLGQVTAVRRDDGQSDMEAYRYGADGQRVRKVRLSHTARRQLLMETRYLPGLELHRNEATGQQWQVLSLEGGLGTVRLLHWSAGLPDGLENDPLRYSFSDHLGSSVMELDGTGAVIGQEGYYPFGGTAWWTSRSALEANHKTVRYSGKERDATGLIYYGYRYYAPWLQRWTSPDPGGVEMGLAMYGFVGNSPVVNREVNGKIYEAHGGIAERAAARRGDKVLYRGLDELGDRAVNVEQALEKIELIYATALDTLDQPTAESTQVLEDYFFVTNPQDKQKLRDTWAASKAVAAEYRGAWGRGKFLVLQTANPLSLGVVSKGDFNGIISFNEQLLSKPENLTITLGHEITHITRANRITAIGPSTNDHFYVSRLRVSVVAPTPKIPTRYRMLEREVSASIMEGKLPYHYFKKLTGNKFAIGVDQFFERPTGTSDPAKAYVEFQRNPMLRTHLALENADGIFHAAYDLYKLRQPRTAHEPHR